MVLPPPVAHDAPGPDVPVWLRRLSVILGLSRAGVLVLVDHAHPERLGELVRALLPAHPELEVHCEARRLAEVEPGSTLVLVPRAEDADWLNINRPLFAARSLRVVLFSPRDTSVALAQRAVDFFDWISHRMECPPGPVPFAVAGLRRALAVRAPGIVWKGGDLEAALHAARPRRKLSRISASRPYEQLVAEARAARGDWLAWTDVDGDFRLRRVRWALAEARRRARTILVEPAVSSPGWWEAHGRLMEFQAARGRLERAGACRPGRLAALMDLEPEAVELLSVLLESGLPERTLEAEVRRGTDGGATIGRLALARGLVAQKELARWKAASPVIRAFSEDGRQARRLRELEGDALVQRVKRGEGLDAEDAAWWAASLTRLPPFGVDQEGQLSPGGLAEVRLRRGVVTGSAWEKLASLARAAGDLEVARWWAHQESESEPSPYISRLFARTAFEQSKWARAESLLFLPRVAEADEEFGWAPHERAAGLERQGRYTEAEGLLRQVLATVESKVGNAHPDYAAMLHSLARVLGRQGRYKEAEGLLRQVLTINERALGMAHPGYAAALHALASVLERQGRYSEAEELLRQVLAIDERALRVSRPDYVVSLRELARVLERQGRYAEAERVLHQAVTLGENTLGAKHPELCSTLTLLGFILAKQARPQEGEPFLRRAVEIALANWGLHHAETAQALHRLAHVQAALKEKEAGTTAQQAVEALLHSLGPEHPITQQALPELNRILEEHG